MLKSAQIQNKVISNLWYFDIIIIRSFYTALFSALEHLTVHVTCDSERVTVSFYSAD